MLVKDKKKPDQDHVENKAEKDCPGQAPAGLDLAPEKPLKLLSHRVEHTPL